MSTNAGLLLGNTVHDNAQLLGTVNRNALLFVVLVIHVVAGSRHKWLLLDYTLEGRAPRAYIVVIPCVCVSICRLHLFLCDNY